ARMKTTSTPSQACFSRGRFSSATVRLHFGSPLGPAPRVGLASSAIFSVAQEATRDFASVLMAASVTPGSAALAICSRMLIPAVPMPKIFTETARVESSIYILSSFEQLSDRRFDAVAQ